MARPANKKRNSMPAFIDVGLVAAKDIIRVVIFRQQLFELRLWRAAVVAGHNDERRIGQTLFFQRFEHLAQRGIGVHDEIGVGVEATLALPLGLWRDGRVWRGQW